LQILRHPPSEACKVGVRGGRRESVAVALKEGEKWKKSNFVLISCEYLTPYEEMATREPF